MVSLLVRHLSFRISSSWTVVISLLCSRVQTLLVTTTHRSVFNDPDALIFFLHGRWALCWIDKSRMHRSPCSGSNAIWRWALHRDNVVLFQLCLCSEMMSKHVGPPAGTKTRVESKLISAHSKRNFYSSPQQYGRDALVIETISGWLATTCTSLRGTSIHFVNKDIQCAFLHGLPIVLTVFRNHRNPGYQDF